MWLPLRVYFKVFVPLSSTTMVLLAIFSTLPFIGFQPLTFLRSPNFKSPRYRELYVQHSCYTQFYRIKGEGIYLYIFKFRENMSKNRFREIPLSVHKIAKFEYFAKVIIYSKSPDHVL